MRVGSRTRIADGHHGPGFLSRRRSHINPELLVLFLLLFLAASRVAAQQTPVTNEYRVTVFPHFPIKGKVSGFSYVGYVANPDSHYSLYYLGIPGLTYRVNEYVQLWGGAYYIYTNNHTFKNGKQDTLELRPFVGAKLFLPNKIKWNIYNFTRLEFRETYSHSTKDWANVERLRSRFGVEIPLRSHEEAWKPRTFYAMVTLEPLYRFDNDLVDPMRYQFGFGYITHDRVRLEFLYYANLSRVAPTNDLEFAQNIFRLNIKVGLKQSLLSAIRNPEHE